VLGNASATAAAPESVRGNFSIAYKPLAWRLDGWACCSWSNLKFERRDGPHKMASDIKPVSFLQLDDPELTVLINRVLGNQASRKVLGPDSTAVLQELLAKMEQTRKSATVAPGKK